MKWWGLLVMAKLRRDYDNNPNGMTQQEYAIDCVKQWKIATGGDDLASLIDTTRLLSTIENTGLLVRRKYVSLDDVYFAFEGTLRSVDSLWYDYLIEERSIPGREHDGEHAIWLLNQIRIHKPRRGALLP